MSTKAAMATEATPTNISFTLAATTLNDAVISYFFPEPNPNIVVTPGDQVQFSVEVPSGLRLPANKVATYITFTGTNSKSFSVTDPIPWPFLDSDRDPVTGYQIVLQAGILSKAYTVKPDTSRSLVSYNYSIYVKVNSATMSGGAGDAGFYEFRHDPEMYVDEC